MSICNAITQFNRGFMSGMGWSLGFGLSNFINNTLFGFNSFMPFGFGLGFGNLYRYPEYGTLQSMPYPELNTSIWELPSLPQTNYSINLSNFDTSFSTFNTNVPTFNTNIQTFDTFGPSFGNMNYMFDTFSASPIRTATPSKKGGDAKSRIGTFSSTAATYGAKMAENASYYVGKVNNDSDGNALFSGGEARHWCADFVTSIAKKSYGSKLPSNFGQALRNGEYYTSSSVYGLMYWGDNNNCYLEVPQNNDDKAEFIAENVKEGDIMIQKNSGASHTGIVTRVYDDGSFDTVEGNSSDSVAAMHYSADDSKLSGFVSLSKFA